MPYMPSPAIPPGMDPKAWQVVLDAIANQAADLAADLASGKPVGRGRAAQIRALRAQAAAFRRITPWGSTADADLVALWAMQGMVTRLRDDGLNAIKASLDQHALASADELEEYAKAHGMPVVANPNALHALAARSQQAITHDWERLLEDTQHRIRDGVARGMVAGQNPRDVARHIRGVVTEQGAMTYSRARLIAQTEMADLYDASRLQTMTDNADVFGGWWWRARPDACSICQIKHGMIHATAEQPFRHHNCRCVMVPIVGEPPGPPGTYMPGEQRSKAQIRATLPPKYQAALDSGVAPEDLLGLRGNNGWRDSLTLRDPGALSTGRPPAKKQAPAAKQPKPAPVEYVSVKPEDTLTWKEQQYTLQARKKMMAFDQEGLKVSQERVVMMTQELADLKADLKAKHPDWSAREVNAELKAVYPYRQSELAYWKKRLKQHQDNLAPLQKQVDEIEARLARVTNADAEFAALVKGPPMDVDTAWQGTNAEWKQDVDLQVNCTRVAAAYELRLRGYQVRAEAAGKSLGWSKTDPHSADKWRTRDGQKREFKDHTGGRHEAEAEVMSWPVGARGFMTGAWKNGGAHIWNVERTSTGWRIIEAQPDSVPGHSGDLGTSYFPELKPKSITTLRVDDMVPTSEIAWWVRP